MEVIGTKGTTHINRKDEAIDAILEDKFTCPRTFLNYKVFDEWVGAMPSSVRSFVNACKWLFYIRSCSEIFPSYPLVLLDGRS